MPRTSRTAAARGTSGAPLIAPKINGMAVSQDEANFVFALVGSLKSKPDVNWEELIATTGLKDKKSKFV